MTTCLRLLSALLIGFGLFVSQLPAHARGDNHNDGCNQRFMDCPNKDSGSGGSGSGGSGSGGSGSGGSGSGGSGQGKR